MAPTNTVKEQKCKYPLPKEILISLEFRTFLKRIFDEDALSVNDNFLNIENEKTYNYIVIVFIYIISYS